MKNTFPGGVWPTMITPFTLENHVDYEALNAMVEWYISKGVSGLFAVCQSSEMFFLSLEERVEIAKFVVKATAGRVPVIASGHISDLLDDQVEELNAIAKTGVDAVILVTNRLAHQEESDKTWLQNLQALISKLPQNMPLGFYECPYPYKRLLSIEALKWCASNGRFFFLKDTCCDAVSIREKLQVIKGSNLKLYNANTTTLLDSLRNGAVGYSGVMANFHPALYTWLCDHKNDQKADQLLDHLSIFSLIERQLYPVNAKYSMSLYGLPMSLQTRSKDHREFTPTFAEEVAMLKRLSDTLEKTFY